MEEKAWWNALEGNAVEANAWGDPPYDAASAARVLDESLGIQDAQTVLDLGCGPGRVMGALHLVTGCRVIGLDVSSTMIQQAPAHTRRTFDIQVGDGRTLPPSLPSFDHAYSITMFEHIPHEATKSYMKQIHDRLPPGGRFVFTHTPGHDPRTFLHHQCGNVAEPIEWALDAGFDDAGVIPLPPVLEAAGAWVWYRAEKS